MAIFEFSLNDFLRIQRIQWTMTKSKSSMVTRDILYLTVDTFLDIVVKSNFLLLSVGWYLFRVVSANRYLPRGSNENTLCITSTDNISVARWVIPLVTILLLDLVMIHWICWIQGKSFRENSIANFILYEQWRVKTEQGTQKFFFKRVCLITFCQIYYVSKILWSCNS